MTRKYERHKMTNTPEHRAWVSMRDRCFNKNCKDYWRYGGVGITVCPEWKNSLLAFVGHVGKKPGPGFSLDRIDGTRGYEPGNVRWATFRQQSNNMKRNRIVNYRGRVTTVAEAVRMAGSVIGRENAIARLNLGWTVAKAVETPPLYHRDSNPRRIENVA